MAGITGVPNQPHSPAPESGSGTLAPGSTQLSLQQFKTIAWLRWRVFVNALRGKGATGELIVKIISYPLLALIVFGPAIGAGAASWYLVSNHLEAYLAIPLWIIFALWQFIGVSTSTTGPSFDLSTLTRFPLRYRDYLLMRLSFGLMDPPTLAGIACLVAMTIGIGIASSSLAPWAGLVLLVYALANILFSRMVYSWMERWMAQRRTRELVTILILLFSMGIQVVSQFAGKLGKHAVHHTQASPAMETAKHIALTVNWLLPPGMAAFSIEHMHDGLALLAVAALVGLAAYAAAFLLILHIRLKAQYLGENLSEAPVAAVRRKKTQSGPAIGQTSRQNVPQAAALRAPAAPGRSILPAAVSACLVKEVRYLLRSGPKLYTLILPVFMILLFTARNSSMSQAGLTSGSFKSFVFSYGCAYTQLIIVAMLYNSFGSDGTGAQFYFLAPVRMRDVVLAKNILVGIVMAIEMALILIVSSYLNTSFDLALVVATIAWTVFAFLLNTSVGNIRSITSPKANDPSKLRRQNVSGLNSLISLAIVFGCIALGAGTLALCYWRNVSEWVAAAVFLVLAVLSCGVYLLVYQRLDAITDRHREDMTRELSKA